MINKLIIKYIIYNKERNSVEKDLKYFFSNEKTTVIWESDREMIITSDIDTIIGMEYRMERELNYEFTSTFDNTFVR